MVFRSGRYMPFSEELFELAYGSDIYFDVVFAVVFIFLFAAAIRYARISRDSKKYISLMSGFGMMALAYCFKILSHFTIYYHSAYTHQVGVYTLTHHAIQSSNVLVYFGLLAFRVLFLLGLYALYHQYASKDSVWTTWLIAVSLALIAYLSRFEFVVFHIAAAILLVFLAWRYSRIACERKSVCSKMLAGGFGVLALSQLLFIATVSVPVIYFIGEFVQVIGSVMILASYVHVILNGKKARSH